MRYFTGVIGGIPLEESPGVPAGFQLTGAAAFVSSVTGNTVTAADGSPQTQYVALPFGGRRIELSFIHIPAALLSALLSALDATLVDGSSLPCSFTDGFQTIEGAFKPDVPAWYERGEPDGDYIRDAILRLISTGV